MKKSMGKDLKNFGAEMMIKVRSVGLCVSEKLYEGVVVLKVMYEAGSEDMRTDKKC